MIATSPRNHGKVPVLTYHSQNIEGNQYADNNHVALASDLAAIADMGMRVVPLRYVVEWIIGERPGEDLQRGVAITCDDGCLFDFEDLSYRDYGMQTSFRKLAQAHGAHLTLFVIASAEARAQIGARRLGDPELMTDSWWRVAEASDWCAIENHGWDHCHDCVDYPIGGKGSFVGVDTQALCDQQVAVAADTIARLSGRRPDIFAYPYGESSDYIRDDYMPNGDHGMIAAIGIGPVCASRESSRWAVPRFICGYDWNSPQQFQALLSDARRSWT